MSTRIVVGRRLPGLLVSADYRVETVAQAEAVALQVYWQRPLKVYTASATDAGVLALCAAWLTIEPRTLPASVAVVEGGRCRWLDEAWLIRQVQRFKEKSRSSVARA